MLTMTKKFTGHNSQRSDADNDKKVTSYNSKKSDADNDKKVTIYNTVREAVLTMTKRSPVIRQTEK